MLVVCVHEETSPQLVSGRVEVFCREATREFCRQVCGDSLMWRREAECGGPGAYSVKTSTNRCRLITRGQHANLLVARGGYRQFANGGVASPSLAISKGLLPRRRLLGQKWKRVNWFIQLRRQYANVPLYYLLVVFIFTCIVFFFRRPFTRSSITQQTTTSTASLTLTSSELSFDLLAANPTRI